MGSRMPSKGWVHPVSSPGPHVFTKLVGMLWQQNLSTSVKCGGDYETRDSKVIGDRGGRHTGSKHGYTSLKMRLKIIYCYNSIWLLNIAEPLSTQWRDPRERQEWDPTGVTKPLWSTNELRQKLSPESFSLPPPSHLVLVLLFHLSSIFKKN